MREFFFSSPLGIITFILLLPVIFLYTFLFRDEMKGGNNGI